jgi:hypothetical protein
MTHASAAAATAKVEVIKERPFTSPPVGFNSALDISASPVSKQNDEDNCQETETKIKDIKRVMCQQSKKCRDTEERTTSCSQPWHTWFRRVHVPAILSRTPSQVNESPLVVAAK